jgi:MYXO-CTERM domain-containing protein
MSGCWIGPYINVSDPPIDCPIEVYIRASDVAFTPITATTYRNNASVDLTGNVENLGDVQIPFSYYTCEGMLERQTPEAYGHYKITLANAQVGDQVWVVGSQVGHVQTSGACPAPQQLPTPSCTGDYDGCQNNWADGGIDDPGGSGPFDPGGCSAGTAPGLALGIAALVIVGRKRKRRR